MSMQEELEALKELEARAELFDALDSGEVSMEWNEPALAIKAFLLREEITEEEWFSGSARGYKKMRISGYTVDKVSPGTALAWSERLAECLLEWFDEDFGPTEEPTDLTDAELIALQAKGREMVELLLSMGKVCRLTQVGEVELGVEAVRELLKGRPAREGEDVQDVT